MSLQNISFDYFDEVDRLEAVNEALVDFYSEMHSYWNRYYSNVNETKTISPSGKDFSLSHKPSKFRQVEGKSKYIYNIANVSIEIDRKQLW